MRINMAFATLAIVLCLPNCVSGQTDATARLAGFLDWWESNLWIRARAPLPEGITSERHSLQSLPPYDGAVDLVDFVVEADSVQLLALTSTASRTWILVVPWAEPETGEEWERCLRWKSLLVPSDGGRPVIIDLNPWCNEVYGPNEVDFAVYRVVGLRDPWVEMVTNGPACVPAFLYGYSAGATGFEKIGESCGG